MSANLNFLGGFKARQIDKAKGGCVCMWIGKARAATKVNPTVVNAVHAFYHSEGVDTECPDYNITQHTSTGRRYPSANAFYSSMHDTQHAKEWGQGR